LRYRPGELRDRLGKHADPFPAKGQLPFDQGFDIVLGSWDATVYNGSIVHSIPIDGGLMTGLVV
jgi:hypothetical protein